MKGVQIAEFQARATGIAGYTLTLTIRLQGRSSKDVERVICDELNVGSTNDPARCYFPEIYKWFPTAEEAIIGLERARNALSLRA